MRCNLGVLPSLSRWRVAKQCQTGLHEVLGSNGVSGVGATGWRSRHLRRGWWGRWLGCWSSVVRCSGLIFFLVESLSGFASQSLGTPLARDLATLVVYSNADRDRLVVDGRDYGSTRSGGRSIEVSLGRHEVRVEKGLIGCEIRVWLRKGEELTLYADPWKNSFGLVSSLGQPVTSKVERNGDFCFDCATVRVANQCNRALWIAMYLKGYRADVWEMHKWYRLNPGEQTEILSTRNRYFGVYAQSADWQSYWAGNAREVIDGAEYWFTEVDIGTRVTTYTYRFGCGSAPTVDTFSQSSRGKKPERDGTPLLALMAQVRGSWIVENSKESSVMQMWIRADGQVDQLRTTTMGMQFNGGKPIVVDRNVGTIRVVAATKMKIQFKHSTLTATYWPETDQLETVCREPYYSQYIYDRRTGTNRGR